MTSLRFLIAENRKRRRLYSFRILCSAKSRAQVADLEPYKQDLETEISVEYINPFNPITYTYPKNFTRFLDRNYSPICCCYRAPDQAALKLFWCPYKGSIWSNNAPIGIPASQDQRSAHSAKSEIAGMNVVSSSSLLHVSCTVLVYSQLWLN